MSLRITDLRLVLLIATAFGANALPAGAAEWRQLATDRFEIFTTESEAHGRAALVTLENAQTYFEQLSGFHFTAEGSIRVVALQSKEEYEPFRLHQNAFAHYLKGQQQDYIVLQDIRGDHQQALIHEYTHYVARRCGLTLPVWLNEGMADFYSSLAVENGLATVGTPLHSRMITLMKDSWMPLRRVVKTDRQSSYLDESEMVSSFYAESWALTHMLISDHRYAGGFERLSHDLSGGMDTERAFAEVYGKSVEAVEKDLALYVATFGSQLDPVSNKIVPQHLSPEVRTLSKRETEYLTVELLAAQPWTMSQGEGGLLKLEAQSPADLRVQEMLGSLAWRQGKLEQAGQHLRRAVTLGSQDAETFYRLAQVERKAGADNQRLIALLSSALAIAPAHQDAAFNLAVLQFNERLFADAAATLSRVNKVRPEWAYTYYCLRAYCDMQAKNTASARVFGNLAKQHATNVAESMQAERLLERLATPAGE